MGATPFKTSGSVIPSEFFGRTETIRTVVRGLRTPGNVAVVAPPRAGRSSLLHLLFTNYHMAEPDARLWLIDMQTLNTLPNLIEEIFIGLRNESTDYSLAALAKGLKNWTQRAVFFLDNADRFAAPPFDDEALLALLASHVQTPHLSLCVALKSPPDQVFKRHLGRQLHSLFIQCELPPFSAEDSFQFIGQRLQWTGIDFDGNEVAQLHERSGGMPYELQRLAAALFKQKQALQQHQRDLDEIDQLGTHRPLH
ncbi:MAG: hypothetical protein KA765_13040 [Thermoflexales bacterium]|nr:hypothetical protein [Thermoflexales bacterium]